jgi:hypothetical protein
VPHQARRNVILSHGGKHGRQARTYMKGSSLPAGDAALLPDGIAEGQAEPGQQVGQAPKKARRPKPRGSIKPPETDTVKPPKSAAQLRRWSLGRLQQLARQEGIEGETDKDTLASILATHFNLK